jgi:hypothetical protein
MSTAEPAHHDATHPGAPDAASPHDRTNDHDHDDDNDQRRASIASTMLSEDFENWPGFSSDSNNHTGYSPPTPYTVDDTDNENDDDDELDPQSSAALSRRAELILANAKKRLNVGSTTTSTWTTTADGDRLWKATSAVPASPSSSLPHKAASTATWSCLTTLPAPATETAASMPALGPFPLAPPPTAPLCCIPMAVLITHVV